jgi:crotonobetainyl-CoA:carnitine CoA-transferase CaiB-like acyl-CoA transferase
VPGALDGLLAVEMAGGVAAGFCGRLLAGFGATVVKVEPPEGDAARHARVTIGAPAPDPERAPLFTYLGMGKRSVVLPLDDPRLRRLLERSDLVVADAASAGRAAVTWSELSLHNPALVWLDVSALGSSGPYAGWAAANINVLALGGQLGLTGEPDQAPLCPGGEQALYQLGLSGFAAALLALVVRDRTGLGQEVEVAGVEVVAGALEGFGPTAHHTGVPTPRSGKQRFPLMGIYPCADGHAGIFSMPRQFPTLASVLGDPSMIERMQATSPAELVKVAAELKSKIEEFFLARKRADVLGLARSSGLPMAPVATVADVLESEHLRARGFWADLDLDGAPVRVPGAPCRLPETPWVSRPAPRHGEMDPKELESVASRFVPPRGRGVAAPADAAPAAADPAQAAAADADPAAAIPRDRPAPGPLAGVRVLDLTHFWMGPYACKWFADFGAEVVKVESPNRLDMVRSFVMDWDKDRWYDRSPFFNNYNRGKLSVGIDPVHPDGRQVVLDLAAGSDIVIENLPAGWLGRHGLGYEDLRDVNPDVILVSCTGYGQDGPDAALAGVGTNMEQLSGLAWLNQYADPDVEQPYNTGIAYGDPTGGTLAVAAALMALRNRDRTGHGQHVDLAAHEVLASLIGEHFAAQSLGVSPRAKGNRHPDMVPHGCYPSAGTDRWVTVAVPDDAAWARLGELIGRGDLVDAHPTLDDRRANEYEIDVALMEWTVPRSDTEAAELLQAAGVAAAPVLTTADLPADAHLRLRGYYVAVDDPDLGRWPHDGIAWRLVRTPGSVRGPAPRYGQHTRAVLESVLGYDAERIDGLYRSGAAADVVTR